MIRCKPHTDDSPRLQRPVLPAFVAACIVISLDWSAASAGESLDEFIGRADAAL